MTCDRCNYDYEYVCLTCWENLTAGEAEKHESQGHEIDELMEIVEQHEVPSLFDMILDCVQTAGPDEKIPCSAIDTAAPVKKFSLLIGVHKNFFLIRELPWKKFSSTVAFTKKIFLLYGAPEKIF